MRKTKTRWIAFGVVGGMLAGLLGSMATPALALGRNGKRNIGIGLLAAGAYGALTGRRSLAVAGLAGGAYLLYRSRHHHHYYHHYRHHYYRR